MANPRGAERRGRAMQSAYEILSENPRLSDNAVLERLKGLGLGYRRQDFLGDVTEIRDQVARETGEASKKRAFKNTAEQRRKNLISRFKKSREYRAVPSSLRSILDTFVDASFLEYCTVGDDFSVPLVVTVPESMVEAAGFRIFNESAYVMIAVAELSKAFGPIGGEPEFLDPNQPEKPYGQNQTETENEYEEGEEIADSGDMGITADDLIYGPITDQAAADAFSFANTKWWNIFRSKVDESWCDDSVGGEAERNSFVSRVLALREDAQNMPAPTTTDVAPGYEQGDML